MSLTLYSYYRSSCSYRVRIALNYKNLDYKIEPISLIQDGGLQNKDEYISVNPKSEVPTLLHDNFKISQSVAIIEYLDELYPQIKVYPEDPKQKALVRQACEIINSGIQPLQNLRILKKLKSDFQIKDDQTFRWIQDAISHGLTSYEKLIEPKAGKFSFKDLLTAADFFLIPQVYNAVRYNVNMDKLPKIQSVNEHCLELDSFKDAHPDNQPDTPETKTP